MSLLRICKYTHTNQCNVCAKIISTTLVFPTHTVYIYIKTHTHTRESTTTQIDKKLNKTLVQTIKRGQIHTLTCGSRVMWSNTPARDALHCGLDWGGIVPSVLLIGQWGVGDGVGRWMSLRGQYRVVCIQAYPAVTDNASSVCVSHLIPRSRVILSHSHANQRTAAVEDVQLL